MSYLVFQAQRINLASPTTLGEDNEAAMKEFHLDDSVDEEDEDDEEEEEGDDDDYGRASNNSDDIEVVDDDDENSDVEDNNDDVNDYADDDENQIKDVERGKFDNDGEEDEEESCYSESQSGEEEESDDNNSNILSSNGEYLDDDDFDNNSLEIDEEERIRISAQLNSDREESCSSGGSGGEEEEEEFERKGAELKGQGRLRAKLANGDGLGHVKEEIQEKEDSAQEKHQRKNADSTLFSSKGLFDDTIGPAGDGRDKTIVLTPGTEEEEENSLTESAEGQRSNNSDVEGRLQRLDSERSQLMQDAERDEKQRQWFYKQLSSITHKVEGLNMADKNGPEHERARRQLEQEATQVQTAMTETLGHGQASQLRQEARLARIRSLEKEIRSLQSQGPKQSPRDTRDAATLTNLSKEVSKTKSDTDAPVAGGYVLDRTVSRGGCQVSLATQTGEIRPADSGHGMDGVAPGMPFNPNLYHGAWPIEKGVSARHGPLSSSSDGAGGPLTSGDLASVISFNSTNSSSTTASNNNQVKQKVGAGNVAASAAGSEKEPQQLGSKVEMVYSLLSMLGTHDKDDMSRTLFAMSQSQDSCLAMRHSGCLPLLLQLLHGSDKDSGLLGKTRGSKSARARAAAALHNVVHCQHDDRRARREARTLRLLEQIRAHCDQRRQGEEGEEEEEEDAAQDGGSSCKDIDHHPGAAILALMRLSFDEEYRLAICTLGGLQAIAELLEIDNKQASQDMEYSTTVRRYACMALTNLTFGDGKNKALLCSMRGAMGALVAQLASASEDLIQAAASVLRNLSWRADLASKKTLREIGAVTTLMLAAMAVKKETTLKSILSALWNLSSHCSENKAEICAVEGALQFLVSLLTYKSQAKTLAIVENGGGILRNVSSQVAIREDYRQILRSNGCLQLLLQQLRSTSLTIVSNACGTLWNLSARCAQDQTALRDMGAVAMLRNLVHSKHKMISSGSSAALRNLLASVPEGEGGGSSAGTSGNSSRPSLHARKQRALEEELASQNLSETCENVDSPRNSPVVTATATSSGFPGSRTEAVEGGSIHRSESEPRRFVYHHMNNSNSSVGSDVGSSPAKSDDDGRRHMTRRQMMPRNGTDPGTTNSKRVLSPHGVARAGSQDSVGSTHSDISHDRRRAHSMLAKSSQLLNKRQGNNNNNNNTEGRTSSQVDHKMKLLKQQQHQLQQHLLQQQQQQQQQMHSSSPHPQSSYAPTSGFSPSPALINNTPAHSSRRQHQQQQQQQQHHHPHHYPQAMSIQQQQQQQQQSMPSSSFSQSWQPTNPTTSIPGTPLNNRIVQYMQEVAMYAGVEPHSTFQQNSSLTQSAPTSQSLALHASQNAPSNMYSNTLPASMPSSSANVYYQQQQALMERLGKSSMAVSLASSGAAGQLHLSVEDDADDQPVNYSLKYQDVASSSSQHSPALQFPGHMTSSSVQGQATPSSTAGTFRVNPELLRASGLSSSYTEQTQAGSGSSHNSGSVMLNPALFNSPMQQQQLRRPVPNLIPNRFSTPQSSHMYRGAAHAPFMTPQGAAVTGYPATYNLNHQRFPHPTLSSSFSTPHSSSNQSRSFSLPSAHQTGNPILSRSAMQASLTAYAETDLDLNDQPTDFSLRYTEEVAEDSNPPPARVLRQDYHPAQEEQPINYSLRFHREENMTGTQQEQTQKQDGSGAPNCVECRYAEARRTNEQLDNSSNDDQVRTFCTEGTPYLSTATSLTDLAQVGKRGDNEEDDEGAEEEERERQENRDTKNSNVANIHHQHCKLHRPPNLNDTGSSAAGNLTLVDPDRTLTPADAERSKGEMDLTASSSGSQATDRHTGSTVVAVGRAGSSLSSRAESVDVESQHTQQNFHSDTNEGASDQTKLYCEEGTPTCFSRVSSLSSLHSSEARENSDLHSLKHGTATTEKTDLPCIAESDAQEVCLDPAREKKREAYTGLTTGPLEPCLPTSSTSAGKAGCAPAAPNLRRVTDQGQRSDREAKTVTFDENHQVEETPLMFSRSSSPESLSSFDTQSVHSSVISEYSRRASQVVSPSEIPDSPSESMPSSPPRRAHSPTRRFRDHLNFSTPKATNVLAKQSLDMNRSQSTPRPEPFMNFAAFDETNKPLDFTNRKLTGLPTGASSVNKMVPNPTLMLHNFPAFDDDEEDDQPINFSSRDQESHQPPLTFSTFSKNVPPPPSVAHQHGGGTGYVGGNNTPGRLLTPRGKTSLPTLVEQSVAENAETESSSGKSEIPVVYAEEGTPPNMSETTSLSGITMDQFDIGQGEINPTDSVLTGLAGLSLDSTPSARNPPNLQTQREGPRSQTSLQAKQREQVQVLQQGTDFQQAYSPALNQTQMTVAQQQQQQQYHQDHHSNQQQPPLTRPQPVATEPPKPTIPEEKVENSETVPQATPPVNTSDTDEGPKTDIGLAPSSSEAQIPSVDQVTVASPKTPAPVETDKLDERDSSMSEVSEGEEDILAQCISSGMPTPSASSARKMRRSSSDNALKKRSGIPTKAESTPASSSSSKAGGASSKPAPSKHAASSSKSGSSSSQSPKLPKPSAIPSASSQKSSSKSKHDKTSSGVSQNSQSKDQKSSNTPPPQSVGKPQQASQSQGTKSHQRTAQGSSTGKSSASKNLNPALNRAAAAAAKNPEGLQKRTLLSPAKSSASTKPTGAATVISHHPPSGATANVEDRYADFSRDCVKSYATEGTPINFSAATSLSDLSILTHSSSSPSNKKSSSSSKSPGETDSKSDNSSLCEENEELLLSQMIEQGMPKGRSSNRRYGGDNSGGGGNDGATGGKKQNNKDCNTSAFVPRTSNLRVVAPFHDFVPATDTVKTYNVEGTPRNFSAATSLSDLTIDSIEGPVKSGKTTGNGAGAKVSKSAQPQASYVSGPFSPPPSDSLRTYNIEGSPLTFSHNASSLSSLGDELEARGAGSGVSASPHKDNSGNQQIYTYNAGAVATCDQNESDSSSSIPRERHIVGQSSEDSSVAGDNTNMSSNRPRGVEHPIQYTVEDTPVTFSRNSSLSSLNSLDKGENQLPQSLGIPDSAGNNSGNANRKREQELNQLSDDEDDLADCDPTPSEQALLDQCISSAMPKSRLPRGDERARRHSRAKFLTQRVTRHNSGRPGSRDSSQAQNVSEHVGIGGSSPDGLDKSGTAGNASFLENTLTNGYHSSGEMDSGSQLSLDGDVNNMMTRSCSDTTELCMEFDAPTESLSPSRQSRYGIWKQQHRQRHRSSDGSEVRGHFLQAQQQQNHQQRSQSQEGSLKMHKDMSNKLARDNRVQPSHHYNQLEVSDFAAKVREISKDSMAGLVALKDDTDIDRAVLKGQGTLEVAADRQDEDEDISGDVTLRSQRTRELDDSDDDVDQEFEGDDNFMYEYVEDPEADADKEDENVASFNSELLAENVRLVVSEIRRNGKTITNVRSLGSSTVDEEMFLENETISLVSNDTFSDTNSEPSMDVGGSAFDSIAAGAAPPKTGGPKILKPGETGSRIKTNVVKKGDDSQPDGKGIRGRRKPLYPGKTATPQHQQQPVRPGVNSKTTGVVKPNQGKGATANQGSPRATGTSANTSSPSGLKKTSPRSQHNQKVAHVSPTPRVVPGGRNPAVAAAKTPAAPNNTKVSTGLKVKNGAGQIPKTSNGSGSPPQTKNGARTRTGISPHNTSSVRTSPPATQATNKQSRTPSKGTSLPKPSGPGSSSTKRRSSSQQGRDGSAPSVGLHKKVLPTEIASSNTHQNLSPLDNKENKSQMSQGGVVVTMREKKNQSALSSSNRHSNCSQEGGSDGSSGTSDRPNSWGKALDSYNFYVDETQDGQAYKQIQNQRNSRDAPDSIKHSLKKTSVSANQQTSAASPNQSRLPTAANKSVRSTSRSGIPSRSPSAGRGTSASKTTTPSKLNQQQVSSNGRGRGSIPTKTTLHKSNDSLKSQSRPLTPNGRRSSSNSSGSGIPTSRRTVEGAGSSPSSSAVNGKRSQAPSKIASLRRRDGSLDSSPFSGSSTSSSPPQSSRLPTKQSHQPTRSLPPSGIAPHSTKKASTLPAGLSLDEAVKAAGVSKSSTFEKLSSEIQSPALSVDIQTEDKERSLKVASDKGKSLPVTSSGLSRTSGSFDSPETGVRRGEVFELCDHNADEGDYDDVYEGTDDDPDASAEAIPVFEVYEDYEAIEPPVEIAQDTAEPSLLVESPAKIDSSTYRRRKPASDFELPNADETCRSMCSFNESLISPAPVTSPQGFRAVSSASSSNSISDHASTSSKAEEKTKGKSKVAQGLKRLFSSGRGKSKDSEKHTSSSSSSSSKSGKKSSKWDRKHSKDLDFFSRNIKMEPSRLVDTEDDHLHHTSGIHLRTGGSTSGDHKFSPSAIVTPFNYSPPSVGHYANSNGVMVVDLNNSTAPLDNTKMGSNPLSNDNDRIGNRLTTKRNGTEEDPACFITTV